MSISITHSDNQIIVFPNRAWIPLGLPRRAWIPLGLLSQAMAQVKPGGGMLPPFRDSKQREAGLLQRPIAARPKWSPKRLAASPDGPCQTVFRLNNGSAWRGVSGLGRQREAGLLQRPISARPKFSQE